MRQNAPSSIEHEAQAWLSIRLGDQPLVPPNLREAGTPREIKAAALARLAMMRRDRNLRTRQ